MKSFSQWFDEQQILKMPEGPKGSLDKIMAIISYMEPKDIEECKPELFQLKDLIDDRLSGST